jgi:Uma2 family endonuclease
MEVIEMHYKRFKFDDDEFYTFCQENETLRFERDAQGNIFIMPNTGGKTGRLNSKLTARFEIWNEKAQLGEVFDSSTAFKLPTTAVRSPDVAWISSERWNALSEKEQTQFPPLCPDFVLELVSVTDDLKTAKSKMQQEWIANGCRLAWLIDPHGQTVHIYRENGEIQIVSGFDKKLSGENVLEGFELDLAPLKM